MVCGTLRPWNLPGASPLMHQDAEVWQPTSEEKRAMFRAYLQGQEDAESESPCDPSFFAAIPERRRYQEGYWVRKMSMAFHDAPG
jgi:hypothetical protein